MAGAQEITRGPFLQQLGTDSVIVVWETDQDSEGQLLVGLDESYGYLFFDDRIDYHHEIEAFGLEPGTKYYYQVVVDSNPSRQGSFTTAPSTSIPFRFLVFGDNRDDRGSTENHQALMFNMIAEGAEFLINTGDMVDFGIEMWDWNQQWDNFFSDERELLNHVPVWPTYGNHEQFGRLMQIWKKIFCLPLHVDEIERHYYDFRYANSHFIIMDTYDTLVGEYISDAQKAFVRYSLAEAALDPDIQHIFIAAHWGPYSSSNHGNNKRLRNFIEQDLEYAERIDYVFAGHDHNYERWEAESGLKGFVTGGGGAGLYPQEKFDTTYSRFFLEDYHYLVIDVDGPWLRVCPKLTDGTPIEDCLETGQQPDIEGQGEESGEEPGEEEEHRENRDAGVTDADGGGNDFDTTDEQEESLDDDNLVEPTAGCSCQTTTPATNIFFLLLGLLVFIWTFYSRYH
jgi:hypothetical protein